AIDPTLVGAGDGSGDVVSAAGPLQVRLPQDPSRRPVQVSAGGASIAMRLEGAQSSLLSTTGARADYPAVRAAGAVRSPAPAGALRESVVLKARRAGPVSFTFLLDVSPGLVLTLKPNGSVEAAGAAGALQLVIPSPLLMEPATAGGIGAQSPSVA